MLPNIHNTFHLFKVYDGNQYSTEEKSNILFYAAFIRISKIYYLKHWHQLIKDFCLDFVVVVVVVVGGHNLSRNRFVSALLPKGLAQKGRPSSAIVWLWTQGGASANISQGAAPWQKVQEEKSAVIMKLNVFEGFLCSCLWLCNAHYTDAFVHMENLMFS